MAIEHYVAEMLWILRAFQRRLFEKFIDKGFLDNYADIYCLEKYRDSIVEMEGFGEKSYNNLISAIEKSKNVNLCNFIYALGINNVV